MPAFIFQAEQKADRNGAVWRNIDGKSGDSEIFQADPPFMYLANKHKPSSVVVSTLLGFWVIRFTLPYIPLASLSSSI